MSETTKPKIPEEWTDTERWIWEQACAGELADLNEEYDSAPDPSKEEEWTDDRIVTPKFLETILLDKDYSKQVPRKGVRIIGAWFKEKVDLSNGNIAFPLALHNSRFGKGIDLLDFKTERVLSLQGARIIGLFDGQRLSVQSNLFMDTGAHFDAVNLGGAHIGGQLAMVGAKVAGTLGMDSLQVDGPLLMRSDGNDRAEFNDIVLRSTRIGGQLDMTGAKVAGMLNMDSLQVEGSLFMRGDGMNRLEVEGNIDQIHATVGGGIDFRDVTIGENVDTIDFSGTNIVSELRLWAPDTTNKWSDATFILKNVTCGALQDHETNAWPDGNGKLDLTGFEYKALGGLEGETDGSIAHRSVSSMKNWLDRQKEFSPQPYRQLVSVLTKGGHDRKAWKISYAMAVELHKREEGWINRKWLWVVWLTVGYGYYNLVVLLWMALFIGVGVVALQWSGEAERLGILGLAYSIDMLLPIVKLRPLHYGVGFDLTHEHARWYFYVHQLVGWALALFLDAGLSGLTKR